MAAVTIGSQTYEYPAGTPYEKIVRDRLGGEDRTVLLVSVNGRLRELHKEVKGDCSLEFVTASDPSGFLAYQRSAVFLMLKAFYDVAGKENVRKLTVCFSMGDGLYVEPEGDFSLTPELIGEVKKAMERLAARDLPLYKRSENTEDAVELFARHNVYTREEMESREEALLEEYYKTLRIEALTMSDMVREEIVPACVNYEGDLSRVVRNKKEAGITDGMETELLGRISALTKELYHKCDELERAVAAAPRAESKMLADYYHDVVLPAMEEVRIPADKLEMLVGKKYWPFPTYSDILFYV